MPALLFEAQNEVRRFYVNIGVFFAIYEHTTTLYMHLLQKTRNKQGNTSRN
jgi:hypothetical protein